MPKQLVYQKRKWKRRPSKMNKLEKKVNFLMKSDETKYHDESLPSSFVRYNVNNVTLLCDPGQGQTTQTRIGNEISPYRIHLKGRIQTGSGTVTTTRLTLIQAKQGYVPVSNGTTALSKFYALPNSPQTPFSPLDENNRQHFVVLWDRIFTLEPGKEAVQFMVNKKISRNVTFQEAGSTTSEKGQLYWVRTSDQGTDVVVHNAYSRIFYKD